MPRLKRFRKRRLGIKPKCDHDWKWVGSRDTGERGLFATQFLLNQVYECKKCKEQDFREE